jgi:hypothetical protein
MGAPIRKRSSSSYSLRNRQNALPVKQMAVALVWYCDCGTLKSCAAGPPLPARPLAGTASGTFSCEAISVKVTKKSRSRSRP